MASAYQLPDRIVLHSNVVYESGLAVGSEPVVVTSIHDDPSEIGRKIQLVLDAARLNVPDPDQYRTDLDPVLKAAGLRSHRKLQQQALYCTIEEDGDGYLLIPTHNGGTKGNTKGFQDLPDNQIRLKLRSPTDQLGHSLLGAFERCTSIYSAS